MNPYVAIVGTAITYGVLCAVPATGMTYVIDNYRALAGETMTILNAAKNTFAFGLSFGVFPWIEKEGFLRVRTDIPLMLVSSNMLTRLQVSGYNLLISGVIFLTTIPMFIYGERIRRWTARFTV